MEELKIVPMEERHLDALVQLEQACFTTPWSRDGLAAELHNPGAVFAVAELNGITVGYAGMNCVLDECYVDNVAVFPQYRRRGIAHMLMQHLIAAAQERNAAFITLEARISNTGAIALYESLGFQEVGRRPGFYRNPKEDALILTKYLNKNAERLV
ncbi:MAG: [Ribosomal protein S18]-alanine N-acetyltransferase [Thermocaproicibacter melissae]|jgi:[ribosomal protein S18]-alanine N-acetyltransferase|uniref:ribosomal protein S18-alanine N-acetyltransferase n=1 Tax=Thermocaproicibacter melissae TaxID=2966552 RepID=UPI003A0FBDE1